jgi:3-keto-disaccharide hydrolase
MTSLAIVALVGPTIASDAPNTLTAAEKSAGWRLLFDGTTATGWRGYGKPDMTGLRWTVKDGAICLPPADGADTRGHRDIISADTFGDFDLTWQWQVQPGSNSGVKYFVAETAGAAIGHEYQIIDDAKHPDAKVSTERQTASFYDVKSATARPTKPVGEWNTSRVLVQGNHVEHWLNGTKVLEYELGSPETLAAVQDSKFKTNPGFGTKKPGHILLQDHGDAVCYRSIKVRRGTT